MLLYPLFIYFGIARFSARFFAAGLAMALVYRISQLPQPDRQRFLWPTAIAAIYTALIAITNSQQALLLYPVAINLLLLFVFARSLSDEYTVIERFAQHMKEEPNASARSYMRSLNTVWCVFFGMNAAVSGYTAYFRSFEDWALYNGFISYIAIACLFGAEYIFRGIYKRTQVKRLQ